MDVALSDIARYVRARAYDAHTFWGWVNILAIRDVRGN